MPGNSLQLKDRGVVDALARALGHPPPFTTRECESFDGALEVSGARDLSVLGQFRSLKKLQVFGSDLDALTAVASMHDLESLRIIACPITKLDPLRGLPRLEELEVSFTFVEDAAPIFTLPALRRLRLLGNPLTQASYERVRSGPKPPALGQQRPPAIHVTSPPQWELGLKLRRASALCLSAVDYWVPLLVKPGTDWARSRSVAFGQLQAILKETDGTTEAILGLPWPPSTAVSASDIVSARVIGDAGDALGWIDRSDLPAGEADALRRFVSGFSGLVYYRDGEPTLADTEQTEEVRLPEWYRTARMTLGFAFPGEFVTSFLAGREDDDIDYDIGLSGYDSSSGPGMKAAGYFPVAVASDHSVTFAIKLEGHDRRIYELREEWYEEPKRAPKKGGPWVAFPSYAAMLANIVSIQRADGTLVRREGVETARPAKKASRAKRSPRARGASKAAPKTRRRKR